MLEKNKDYIELKAACCSADYCQGYMTHLDITGYSNSDLATPLPNPGTDYILISKEKFEALQTENEQLEKEVSDYKEQIQSLCKVIERWKYVTCCSTPDDAKDLIDSGASWHYAYNESKKVNKKFADSIKAWQNVTGYSTPEDYLAAVIKNTSKATLSWQEITGFSTPEKCSSYIDTLEEKLEDIKNLIEED